MERQQIREQGKDMQTAEGRRRADPDRAGDGVGAAAGVGLRLPHRVQQGADPIAIAPARLGQADLARAAMQQRDAEPLFQPGDRLADGRLRHAEPPGGG
jgi:hypothetical protein